MRGPRSAQPAPISSPRCPDPPLPPPPAEVLQVCARTVEAPRSRSSLKGARALRKGLCSGEVGKILDRAKAADAADTNATLSTEQGVSGQQRSRPESPGPWLAVLGPESSSGQPQQEEQQQQRHQAQQGMKRSSTAASLEACGGAPAVALLSAGARQKLAKQRSCPALLAHNAQGSWRSISDGADHESRQTSRVHSSVHSAGAQLRMDFSSLEEEAPLEGHKASHHDEDAKGEDRQKPCLQDMPMPRHSQPMEAIGWLTQQLRSELEEQAKRHAILIEGLHCMLMSDLAAASASMKGTAEMGLDAPGSIVDDAHPSAAHLETPLTRIDSSAELPAPDVGDARSRSFFQDGSCGTELLQPRRRVSAALYASEPPPARLSGRLSSDLFASDTSSCFRGAAGSQLGSGSEKRRTIEQSKSMPPNRMEGSKSVVISRLKHSSTNEHIDGMLEDRGFHQLSVNSANSLGSPDPLRHSVLKSLWTATRRFSRRLVVDSHRWDYIMGIIILANCVNVGVEIQLSLMGMEVIVMKILEHVFLCIFLVELMVRVIAGGKQAFMDPWVQLDAVLVMLGVFAQWILEPLQGLAAETDKNVLGKLLIVRVIRLVRLVRSLRFLRLFQPLWKLVGGIIGSSGTVLSSAMLFLGAMYILACIGVELIGTDAQLLADDEARPVVLRHFDSLPKLMLTLIQFATCDSIGVIYFPLICARPLLLIYFLSVLLALPICLMNLVTAMIVDHSIQSSAQDAELERARMRRRLKTLIPALRRIFKELDADGSGEVDVDELDLSKVREAQEVMAAADNRSLHNLFHALDVDGSGRIDQAEFVDGMCHLLLSKVPIENLQILQMLRSQNMDISELKEVLLPPIKEGSESQASAEGLESLDIFGVE